jgi:hypothetical protein
MSEPQNEHDDVVQRASMILREREMPAGPPDSLLDSTLALLDTPTPEIVRRPVLYRFFRSYALRVAASLLLAVGVTLMAIYVMTASPQVAFGDVLGNLKKIQTMRFKQDFTVETPLGHVQASMNVLLVDPAKMRVEATAGPLAGSYTVIDVPARKAIFVPAKFPKAIAVSFSSTERSQKCLEQFEDRDLLQLFRNWNEKDAVKIGDALIEGKKAAEFRIDKPQYSVNIWIDPATQYPIRIVKRRQAAGRTVERVFHSFEYNTPVNPAELTLSAPGGYSTEKWSIDILDPDESDLVESLRSIASVRGGIFPDNLTAANLFSGARLDFGAALKKSAGGSLKEVIQDNLNHVLEIGRGLIFAGDPEAGSDWHYAGRGVSLNAPNRPILWYLPAGKANYRVIYADLSIKELPRESLPAISSTSISRDTTAPRFRLP